MRFRHLTSAVAQILLNASGGAILQRGGNLLVSGYRDGANESGAVYLYNDALELQTTITSPEPGKSNYNFGAKIALGDNKIAVGNSDRFNTGGGVVHIYDLDGSNRIDLQASDGVSNNYYGWWLDISGDTLVVGAGESEKVYIYDLSASDIASTEVMIHKPNVVGFGHTVAVGHGKVVVGAWEHITPYGSGELKGAAYIYDIDGTNEIELIPAQNGHTLGYNTVNYGNGPRAVDEFGKQVGISADKIFVSSRLSGNNNNGAVYTYNHDGSGESLIQVPTIQPGQETYFGMDFVVTDSKLVVGAPDLGGAGGPGSVWVMDHDGSNYVQITSSHTTQYMGRTVAVVADKVVASYEGGDTAGNNRGQIHVFDMDGSNEVVVTSPGDTEDSDLWGQDVAGTSGSYPEKLIVAEGRKTYATDRKVYVMDMNGENLIELPEPETLTQSSSSQYATNIEVSTEGKLVVIQNETKTAYVYDLTTTNEPTSFTLDGSNSTAENDFVLEGNKLYTLGMVNGYRKKLMRYDITTGNLEAAFTTSVNYDLVSSTIDVGNGKVVVASGYNNPRRIFTYDIDDTTGSSETIITPSKAGTENTWNPCRLAVGNGKIVFGDSHQDGIFYIYNLDGSNEIAVDCSDVSVGAAWGNSFTLADSRIGYNAIAIGNEKIALSTNYSGSLVIVSNLDGSELFAIDLAFGYGLSPDETSGAGGSNNEGNFYIANNKIVISATPARVSGNEHDGIVHTFDLDGTNHTMIASPRVPESGYKFGQDVAIYDPTGLTKFANLPAVISNIDASYTLTEGQDTVITASATDPEGDAITWSFEEVKSGSSYVFVSAQGEDDAGSNSGALYVYDPDDISASPIKLTAPDAGSAHNFGNPAVSNDKLIVGARGHGSETGAIYIFDTNDLNAAPTKILPPTGFSQELFGWKVFGFDDYFTVSSQGTEFSVYLYDTNNLSAEPIQLVQHDEDGDIFGNTVAMNSTHIFVTADRDAGPNNENAAGSVYVFDKSNPTVQATKMLSPSMASNEEFGTSLACDDDVLVISRYGATGNGGIFVYDANDLSSPTFTASGLAGDSIGYETIVLTEDKIFVGAGFKDNHGAVYIYNKDNPASDFPVVLTPSDGADWDRFGQTLAVTDTKLFVGAQGDDDQGASSGSMYVYDLNDLSAEPTKILHPSGTAGDAFATYMTSIIPSSALNDVTVTQSDNVFTITPGTTDSNFTLRFKVTDAAGNVTTKTSTFAYDYVNKAPTVSGIVSEYNLTQGQDTVITASATDPEGDAITWSFEEVTSGSYTFVQQPFWTNSGGSNIGRVVVYETSDLNTPVAYLSNPYAGDGDVDGLNVSVYNGKIYVSAYGVAVGGTDNIGAVGVYDAETFEFLHNITPPDAPANAYHYFSADCAPIVHEGKIYIGARGWRNNKGGVYVFDETTYDHVLFIEGDEYSTGSFGGMIKIHNGILYVSQREANISGTRTGRILGYNISSFVFNNDPFANANKLEDRDADFEITASTTQTNQYFGRTFDINDNYLVVGSAYYDEGGALSAGTIWVFDVNNSYNELTRFTPSDAVQNSLYGHHTLLTNDDLLFVSQVGLNAAKFIKYDLSGGVSGLTTSAETVEMGAGNYGYYMSVVGDRLYVGGQASADDKVYVYNTDDLSLVHTFDLESNPYGSAGTASIGPSALNGVTVTQSDNVFTVTPGTADANFQLRITATDSEGNVTSVTPTFAYDYVNQAPSVTGIDAAYTLTQGQDTVITAAATDPEGDAITWSFEEVGESYVFVKGGSNTYVYDPSTMNLVTTLSRGLTKMSVGSGKFAGMAGTTAYVYDLSDLSAAPITIPNNPSVDSTALFDNKLYVGQPDQNSNFGQITVYDLNDLNASPTLVYSSSNKSHAQFAKKIRVAGNKLFATQERAYNEAYGIVQVWDTNDLSAAPTVINNPMNTTLDGWMEVTETHLVFSSTYGYEGSLTHAGTVYVYDLNDLSSPQATLTASSRATNDMFGKYLAVSSKYLMVQNDGNTRKVHVFDMTDLSAAPVELNDGGGAFGRDLSIVGDNLFVGESDVNNSTGRLFVYDGTDLSSAPQEIAGSAEYDNFTSDMVGYPAPSALNGVTVTQSDNVFTVTPGTSDANFTLRITATDSEGNATSVTPTFAYDYVNQAPAVSGIESSYTLTQGQDTVITAAATDPEGDAITWSFEEVATGGSYVIATAWNDDDNGSNSGSLYVYDATDMSAQPTKISGPNENAKFGGSAVQYANKLYVGSWTATNANKVYQYDLTNLSAAPVEILPPASYTDGSFGKYVNIVDDKLAVSTQSQPYKVFLYDTNDLSAEPEVISNPSTDTGNYFGSVVTSNSTHIFIAAYADNGGGSYHGAVFAYDKNDLSAAPVELREIGRYGGSEQFGDTIAADDSHVLISRYGAAGAGGIYRYDASDLSASPTLVGHWDDPSRVNGEFESLGSKTILITEDKVIVGARYAGPIQDGRVYVFDKTEFMSASSLPTPLATLSAQNTNQYDGFGHTISIVNSTLIVNSYGDDDNGTNAGSFYTFDLNDLSAPGTEIHGYDTVAGDGFGWVVLGVSPASALNGTTVTQSNNVFTVTPAQQDATFTLAFKATDSEGNATSVTSDFTLDYVNQAPSVTGIDAAYTLTQGQDTVITASAIDPEGDAITWSFEEVLAGSSGYVVVSAIGDDGYDGSVYIYNSSDLSATPTKLDSPSGSTNFFGRDFEIVGDNLIVTADGDDTLGNDAGAAFVYDMTDLSTAPTKITAPDGASGNKFGYSVTSSSDKVIISSRMVGKVYVYDANDLTATPTVLTGETNDFGDKVTSNSNYIFVSDPFTNHGGNRTGSVYVYDIDSLSLVTEIEHQASGTAYFGKALSANEEKLAVGGWIAGLVYVYDLNNLSSTPETTIYGSGSHRFGISVGLSDNKLVVGASDQSKAYVYDLANLPEYANYQDDLNPNSSFYLGRLDPTNEPTSDDKFGYSVSVNNDNIVIGAYGDNNNTGSTYVYDANDLSATPTILTAFDGAEGDYYGSETVKLFAAAPSALNGVTVTQSDNVFTVTPGMQDATFTLAFKATDTEGNVTSVSSDFTLDYVNQAPSVTGIDAAYTLTQGQDTVITASATDPEGDAITWSFEEVMTGSSYVIVGARYDDDNGSNSGSVYVYDANDLSASPTKLTAFDGAANDSFGTSVATIADKIIVGTPNDDDDGTGSGSVYVFDVNDLSAQPTKLTAFDGAADDNFGSSVAVTADKIVVGAAQDNTYSGSVYVYDINDLSAQPTKLTAFDGSQSASFPFFGWSVATTADKIIVGAYGDNQLGAAYVYDANDLSAQPTKLTAFDGYQSDQFGYSVAATADKIIVGAGGSEPDGWGHSNNFGAVYVYDANDLSATPTKLQAFDGVNYNDFMYDYFGRSVAATADKIVVGAPNDDDNGSDSGSVYVYDANDLSAQPTKLTAFDGDDNDNFGETVFVADDKIIVGAYRDNNNGTISGSVYVYDVNDLSAQPTKLTPSDGVTSGQFGYSIAQITVLSSSLNGVTVTQSDNVFTVTPAQQDATFQLTFKATDSEGNVTSVSSDFTLDYVNQAPVVAGIESSYLLSAGGDAEVITAAATDPEGDAITWSFEEVMSGGGSQIVIGSFLKNNYSGSVFVYDNGDLSSSPTEIYPSDIASGDRFGQEIAATPSHMAVSTWNGKVYVYDQSDLSIAPTKLTSPEGVGNFGQEGLAINDTHLFVGQLSGGPDSNGVVYVYSLSDLSASPTELSQTGGENLGDGGDRFGSVVAADNQSLVVSAPYYDNGVGAQNVGRLYVYDVNDLSAAPTVVSNTGYQDNTETGNRELMLTSDKIIVGSSQYEDGNGVRKGAVFVHDRNNLDQAPVIVMGHEENGNFGLDAYANDDILVVGATSENSSTGAAYVYDMSNLSATPTKLTAYDGAANDGFGWEVYATDSNILIGSYTDDDGGNNSGAVYIYDRSDLSAQPTKLVGQGANAYFGNTFAGYSPNSALNGTTVTQSDNVFTVTPGSEATSFSMRFTATDANGNATTTTSLFTVEAAPEPQMGDLFIGSDGYSTGDFNRELEVDAWTKTSNTSWLAHKSNEGGHMEMGWGTDNQVGGYIELDVVPNTEYTISFSGTATSGAPVGNANYRDAYVNVRVVDSEPVGTNAAALILQTTPSTTGGTYPNGSSADNSYQPQGDKSGYQTLTGTITPHGSKLTIQLLNVNYVVQYFDDFSVTGLIPV